MSPHDVLSGLREALELTEVRVGEILAGHGVEPTPERVQALMGELPCSHELLGQFLDGLILDRRGPRSPGTPAPRPEPRLTNNAIFKKLRIALELQEAQVLGLLAAGGAPLGKRELTPLFRKPDHKHFRSCDDETLAAFIRGLVRSGV